MPGSPYRFGPLDPDRFRHVEDLGEGETSIVTAVIDRELHRTVVLKVAALDPDESDRYSVQREAILLGSVSHPNVLTLHQAGWIDENAFALVVAYCPMTLTDFPPSTPWRELLALALQIGDGLAALHEEDILHRDLKPENIVVDERRRPQIADLGVACMIDDTEALADWVGTPLFMAPEVMAKSGCDVRSDLYSYCMIVFELLFGRLPFETNEAKRRDEVAKVSRPDDMPPAIRDVLVRGLASDPNARWQSMPELLATLRAVAEPPVIESARRKRARATFAALGFVAAALVGFVSISQARADVCEEAERELAAIWSPKTQDELSSKLDSPQVARDLTDWATRWHAARSRECSHAREQELDTTASPCLASLADAFRSTVYALRSPAMRAGLDHAGIVRMLPDPDYCANTPEDAGYGHVGIFKLDRAGVHLATLVTTGDLEGAWRALEAYEVRGQELGSLYHRANAVYWRGMLHFREGEHERALRTLQGAIEEALAIEAQTVAVAAMLGIVEVSTAMRELGQARVAISVARGLILPHDQQRLADLARVEGSALLLGDEAQRQTGIRRLREAVGMEEEAIVRHGGAMSGSASRSRRWRWGCWSWGRGMRRSWRWSGASSCTSGSLASGASGGGGFSFNLVRALVEGWAA
ncbi:MAG: serine/threonine protein kinase [Deltaproteobacteria bacterium]|nr:serine/threonine protein kinase [Deltaproteobacteria bacterium]